ncbi:MAG: 16S rRNA (guanine(527)-N(7))-methyltransferase RsmG [Clostridia bacterium]|nr:16S rRNA (guanine(527)-N(7))-methyltransferase RsmG [Clostridia bacterium]
MEILKNEALKFNIELSKSMLEKFQTYEDMLLEYNSFMNLTAITDPYEVKIKHFIDSLTLLGERKLKPRCSVIDIGAGAGFPSLPNAIVREDVNFTMLDSLGKRVNFLNAVCEKIELKNAKAVHMRAEDGGRDKNMREKFDVAVARAVADLAVLAEYALPFVKEGGYFLAMKGTAPLEEIERAKKAIKILGGQIEKVSEVKIDALNLNHTVVVIKKIAKTPNIYPRKAGTPSKNPL